MNASLTDPAAPVVAVAGGVALRWPTAADAPRLVTLLADGSVARMTARVPFPYALADAESFLDYADGARRTGREYAFAAETAADGMVGMVGLTPMGQDAAELGYWVGPAYRGRGLATAMAQATIAWGTKKLHLRRLIAGHFEDNSASARVLQKIGFAPTGRVEERSCLARGAPVPTRELALSLSPEDVP